MPDYNHDLPYWKFWGKRTFFREKTVEGRSHTKDLCDAYKK